MTDKVDDKKSDSIWELFKFVGRLILNDAILLWGLTITFKRNDEMGQVKMQSIAQKTEHSQNTEHFLVVKKVLGSVCQHTSLLTR